MRKARCWVVLAVVVLVSSVAMASAPGGRESKPLPVALGMSTADVEAKLGKPKETTSAPDATVIWTYREKETWVEISFEGGRVARILQAAVGDDAKEIEGTWKVVSLTVDGNLETDVTGFAIGGGKMTPLGGPGPDETAQYRLESTATPRRIDLMVSGGTLQGIYSLAGDELKMCVIRKPGAGRPAEFGSKPGSDTVMLVLKRQSRDWKHAAASKPGAKEKAAVEAAGPNLVKVSGTVRFNDGTPVPGPDLGRAIVTFVPADLEKGVPEGQIRKGASAKIDAEGRFMMMTFRPGDGVLPGKYKVILLIRQKEDDPSTSLIPLKYTSPQTSGLEISIDKPHSDIEFVVEKR